MELAILEAARASATMDGWPRIAPSPRFRARTSARAVASATSRGDSASVTRPGKVATARSRRCLAPSDAADTARATKSQGTAAALSDGLEGPASSCNTEALPDRAHYLRVFNLRAVPVGPAGLWGPADPAGRAATVPPRDCPRRIRPGSPRAVPVDLEAPGVRGVSGGRVVPVAVAVRAVPTGQVARAVQWDPVDPEAARAARPWAYL